MTHVRAALTGLLVAAAASSTPEAVASAAGWGVQRLGPAHPRTSDPPSLAANARGDAVIAWADQRRAYVAVRRARARRFGRPIRLPRTARAAPEAAMLSDGSVVVAWRAGDGTRTGVRPCCAVLWTARLPAGSRRVGPSRVTTIRGQDVDSSQVAIAAATGRRVVLAGGGSSLAVVSGRSGRFGVPVEASQGMLRTGPRVAAGGAARTAVVWSEHSGSEGLLRAVSVSPSGRISAPRTLLSNSSPALGGPFSQQEIGLDRHGRLTVLWADFATRSIFVGRAALTRGRLGALQRLDLGARPGENVLGPQLSVVPAGRALAAWRHSDFAAGANAGRTAVAVRSHATGAFRRIADIGGWSGARVALTARGTGVVATADGPVRARLVDRAGRLRAPVTLFSSRAQLASLAAVAAGRRLLVAFPSRGGMRVASRTVR